MSDTKTAEEEAVIRAADKVAETWDRVRPGLWADLPRSLRIELDVLRDAAISRQQARRVREEGE